MEENNQNTEELSEETAETEASDDTQKDRRPFSVKDVLDVAESTIITIFFMILLFTYLLHPVNVIGRSMNPTLNDGDRIFMSMINPGYSYGDIIIVNNDAAYLFDYNGNVTAESSGPLDECIIKRVIAKGGQEINIDFETGDVSVDGKVLDEPYINAVTANNDGAFSYPFTVPEGYYFVMGDNRNASSDSRNPFVGLVKQEQIYGRAVVRYAPFSDFKLL